MTRNHRLLLTVALSTAIALPATPALAQSDSGTSSPGGSADSLGRDLVVHSSQNPTSSGSSIDATLSSLRAIGSSQVPLSDPLLSSNEGYPLPTDPTITQARIVAKEVEADNLQVNPGEDRVQRWTVASPSMQRHVSVEIMKPADPAAPAPMLYLLDGVDAPKLSGWIGIGGAQKVLGDENVTVVVPTQAPGSWYSDWNKPDPALGVNMWETFLTTELAPLLEPFGVSFRFAGFDSDLRQASREAEVIVSTVPSAAVEGHEQALAHAPILDVIYEPWPTPLTVAAAANGYLTVGGHIMLAHQAYGQFEQFTGRPAPRAAMRRALEASLQ